MGEPPYGENVALNDGQQVYDPNANAIYDVASGAQVWSAPQATVAHGTASDDYVMYVRNSEVVLLAH